MANNIKMNYEELYSTAKGFNNESDEIEGVLKRAETLIDTLKSGWEGEAALAFEEQFDELKPSVQKMYELFDDIAKQLNDVAKTTLEYDNDIAKKIQSR